MAHGQIRLRLASTWQFNLGATIFSRRWTGTNQDVASENLPPRVEDLTSRRHRLRRDVLTDYGAADQAAGQKRWPAALRAGGPPRVSGRNTISVLRRAEICAKFIRSSVRVVWGVGVRKKHADSFHLGGPRVAGNAQNDGGLDLSADRLLRQRRAFCLRVSTDKRVPLGVAAPPALHRSLGPSICSGTPNHELALPSCDKNSGTEKSLLRFSSCSTGSKTHFDESRLKNLDGHGLKSFPPGPIPPFCNEGIPRLVKGAPDLRSFAHRNGGFGKAGDDKFMAGRLPSWPPDRTGTPKIARAVKAQLSRSQPGS